MSEPKGEPDHWRVWHDSSWPQFDPQAEDEDETVPEEFDGDYEWPDWIH